MKWLKNIGYYFFPLRKPDVEVEDLVELCKQHELKTKDISEPVISFVDTVKNNPKRFKVKRFGMRGSYCVFELVDKLTEECYHFKTWWVNLHDIRIDLAWLTLDEKEYLISNLKPIFIAKRERLASIKEQRLKRIYDKERLRLKGIYCKGEGE